MQTRQQDRKFILILNIFSSQMLARIHHALRYYMDDDTCLRVGWASATCQPIAGSDGRVGDNLSVFDLVTNRCASGILLAQVTNLPNALIL